MQLIAIALTRPIEVLPPPEVDSVPPAKERPVPMVTLLNPPDPLPYKIEVPEVAGAPVDAIVIVPDPLVTDIPVPALKVLEEYPVPLPINNLPLASEPLWYNKVPAAAGTFRLKVDAVLGPTRLT